MQPMKNVLNKPPKQRRQPMRAAAAKALNKRNANSKGGRNSDTAVEEEPLSKNAKLSNPTNFPKPITTKSITNISATVTASSDVVQRDGNKLAQGKPQSQNKFPVPSSQPSTSNVNLLNEKPKTKKISAHASASSNQQDVATASSSLEQQKERPQNKHLEPATIPTSSNMNASNVQVVPAHKRIRVKTLLPLPPNWKSNSDDTIASMVNYKLFSVDASTQEFSVIVGILKQLTISGIEQIVNPSLWSRFINTAKEMIKMKSDDLEVLSKLGFDDAEILENAHSSFNFIKDPAVAAVPYRDNMAILLHCTKHPSNVESILREGLDERMGSSSGLLGKGIYFTDTPLKSIQYDGCGGVIFIFGVLLGDCLSVNHLGNTNKFVREPQKLPTQKRHVNDLFFDSIAGQPGVGRYNEYVIYNRYQCIPLYKIKYSGLRNEFANHAGNDSCSKSNQMLPPFCWMPLIRDGVAMPNKCTNIAWPFSAMTIFKQMGVKEEIETDVGMIIPSDFEEKLTILKELGFDNRSLNVNSLKAYKFNIEETASYLFAKNETEMLATHSSVTCCNKYENDHKISLACGHKFCRDCVKTIETIRTTMSGVWHSFVKCTFCQKVSGTQIGSCPDGMMLQTIIPSHCDGYEECDSILIEYQVNETNYQIYGKAYLPNNTEGFEILKLLRIAWDRRLTFAIGTCAESGRQNVWLWNIQHKLSLTGGVPTHGYPDSFYLGVRSELMKYGIS